MIKLNLYDVHLPLLHPFTIAHGTTTIQHNLIVELTQDGITGYGEGASSHAYAKYDAHSMRQAIEEVRDTIESHTLNTPEELWELLLPVLGHNRFALCAVDEAAHDLWGKLNHKPVWELWGLDLSNRPKSNYTIGIDTTDSMIVKMKEFEGWPCYKIKLGTDHDLEIVRELRKHTSAAFRIDANTAWSAEQTIDYARELKELGVEFIEQPLKADDWDGMKQVYQHSVLPVIADESCLVEEDVVRCVGYFHGVNIKLTKAGGMTPGKRMIDNAKANGLKVMVGCMTESSVGISAIAQLLPLLDYVDMDGAALLAEDVAEGVTVIKGEAIFPDRNGNGVALLKERITV